MGLLEIKHFDCHAQGIHGEADIAREGILCSNVKIMIKSN